MTTEEKRFLKWFFIAVLWAAVTWKLTDLGLLDEYGAGFTLLCVILLFVQNRNPKVREAAFHDQSVAYTAIHRKFGRWTIPAQYGPILLVGLMAGVFRAVPNGITFRLMAGSLLFMIVEGLYLCYLVAEYKAELKEAALEELEGEDDDGKTV